MAEMNTEDLLAAAAFMREVVKFTFEQEKEDGAYIASKTEIPLVSRNGYLIGKAVLQEDFWVFDTTEYGQAVKDGYKSG